MAGNQPSTESCALELINATKDYANELKSNGSSEGYNFTMLENPTTTSQKSLLKSMAKMQLVLDQPSRFLRRLTLHTQLLACLQWLCEFQVLACIPLNSPALVKDVASISDVPESQLRRVTRLMATAGFLEQPTPDKIAHSPLSARFVTEPALLDAAMFMSETVAPAALRMPDATRRSSAAAAGNQASSSALPTPRDFQQQQRLQRQLTAYMSYNINDCEPSLEDVLSHVDLSRSERISVVDVGAEPHYVQETSHLHPQLSSFQLVVQPLVSDSAPFDGSNQPYPQPYGRLQSAIDHHALLPGHHGAFTVQHRAPGAPQLIKDADVYVIRLPSPGPSRTWSSIARLARLEVSVHLEILRNNLNSRVILTALVMPAPASLDQLDPDDEEAILLRDISLMQLANERIAERDEVLGLLKGIGDSSGMLISTNEFRLPSSRTTAFEIRYQPYNTLSGHTH